MRIPRLVSAKSAWMTVFFWTPLMPFFVSTLLRLAFSPSWATIYHLQFLEASDLALSLGVIGVFASDRIAKAELAIADEEFANMRHNAAQWSKNLANALLWLFVACKLVEYLIAERNMASLRVGIFLGQIVVLVLAVLIYSLLDYAQGYFKLKVNGQ